MNAVARTEQRESRALATTAAPTPGELLRIAVEQKADPAYLRELMVLQREWEADQARKSYVAAMAAFKAEPLSITKDKHVSFTTQKGRTEYDHATIGNVVGVINSALGRHGFSHRWDTHQGDGGRITVTCIITHADGHKESTTLAASPDDSGGKNNIQAVASTVTYLQRYTLLAATGMATADQEDDDGRGASHGDRSSSDEAANASRQSNDDTPERRRIVTGLYAVADQGWESLRKAWGDMSPQARSLVGGEFRAIKARAEAVDK